MANQTKSGLPEIRTPHTIIEDDARTITIKGNTVHPLGGEMPVQIDIPATRIQRGWLDVAARAAHNFFALNPLASGAQLQHEYNLTDDECTQVLARMRELGL